MKRLISRRISSRILIAVVGGTVFTLGSLFLGSVTMAAELKVGDQAPQFKLPGSDDKTYQLADLTKEKKVVVVAWYPKAFTGG
jgi:hypothetical protein